MNKVNLRNIYIKTEAKLKIFNRNSQIDIISDSRLTLHAKYTIIQWKSLENNYTL